jgi:hypothetical protein
MIDWIRAQIRAAALAAGGDPALALAVARQESGLNPQARGDSGHSVGLFQENDQGAGYGLTDEDRQQVGGATLRFIERVKRVLSGTDATDPGVIAWEAQRPAGFPDPDAPPSRSYIASIDALYAQELVAAPISDTRDVQPIGGGGGGGSWGTEDQTCPPGSVLRNGRCYTGGGFGPPVDFLPKLPQSKNPDVGQKAKELLDEAHRQTAQVAVGVLVAIAVVGIALVGVEKLGD